MKKSLFGWLSALLIFGFSYLLLTTSSCSHDELPDNNKQEICFTKDVLPIFQNSCATTGCHDANTAEDDYIFTDYANIMKAITPGNASTSKAYQAITSSFEIMPPDNPLPINKRLLVRLWIDQGAKETSCNDTTVIPGTKSGTMYACYERDIQPILSSSCAVSKCHDAITHKEGIDLSSYSKVFATIKPGNPLGSKLYEAITENPGSEDFMPQKPYSALSQAAIDSIFSWIKRGGLHEECASVCDTSGIITYASHIKPIIDLSCRSCHGATNPSGGINLVTENEVKTHTQSGIVLAAIQRKGSIVMPPAYALDACSVREFELWINQGYK